MGKEKPTPRISVSSVIRQSFDHKALNRHSSIIQGFKSGVTTFTASREGTSYTGSTNTAAALTKKQSEPPSINWSKTKSILTNKSYPPQD